ncbi:Uncharacterised protein [uncultured Eubacterium sp.]|nr:Uncharacterised protein [uncultured Eubacterium sp.]
MGCAKRFALWERKSRRTAEKARTTGDDAAYSRDSICDIRFGTFNNADCNASVNNRETITARNEPIFIIHSSAHIFISCLYRTNDDKFRSDISIVGYWEASQ